MKNLAIYIHYPFCKSKCPYCDFNSHVRDSVDNAAFEAAYMRELEHFSSITAQDSAEPRNANNRQITSIFFGGGTPSLMPARLVENIINKIASLWPLADDCEITLEANPTSVEAEKFAAFRAAGVNRVSIGVQSFDEAELKFLGREHSANEAQKAIELAAKIFPRYSFDLIYTLTSQTLSGWEKNLAEALKLTRGHISLYQLTIEPATNFYHRKVQIPPDDVAADFYDLTQKICEAYNLPAYEVSNHASAGNESAHNLTYWRYGEYLGIGAGAHGRINGHASAMVKSPEKWLEKVQANGNGLEVWQKLIPAEQEEERVMMGLRLHEGIEMPTTLDTKKLIADGLLERIGTKTRATKQGMLLLNHIISKLLD
jgi:oxygen-independent coproporphyrinogen-3 oxidase